MLAAYRDAPLDRPRELAGFLRGVGDPFAVADLLGPLLDDPT